MLHCASGDLRVSEAINGVIIDHAHRLHKGVADGRPDELETSAQQISAQGIRLRRPRGNLLERSPLVHPRCATDKAPHVGIKTPEFVVYRKKGLRIAHGTLDLESVANDVRIPEQALDSCPPEMGHCHGIETGEGATIGVALLEYRLPAQASLRTFKRQELEEGTVVVNWNTPLSIVIGNAEGSSGPDAAPVLTHDLLRASDRRLAPARSCRSAASPPRPRPLRGSAGRPCRAWSDQPSARLPRPTDPAAGSC